MSTLSDAYATIWDAQLDCFDARTVDWDGSTLACDVGERRRGDDYEFGGQDKKVRQQVTIKRALISGTPSIGDEVIDNFDDEVFKIASIRTAPDGVTVIWDLEQFDDEEVEPPAEESEFTDPVSGESFIDPESGEAFEDPG